MADLFHWTCFGTYIEYAHCGLTVGVFYIRCMCTLYRIRPLWKMTEIAGSQWAYSI